MQKPRRIYLLNPKEYSPETIAVAFAKTSRSPKPFDEIAAELNDEQSARFHEKWVVGYGHASVAEHAVLHLALENVSRLAIETIEGNRLASYTEKSTRYQQWDQDAFYVPDELVGHRFADEYVHTCQQLFDTYLACIPRVKEWLTVSMPQENGELDQAYERRLKPAAVDICRFLLPAASLANVGVTINARSLEYAICKMLSSPLAEVRAIGQGLLDVGKAETPTLIKYASCNTYLLAVEKKMAANTQNLTNQENHNYDFRLHAWDADGETRVLAASLLRFSRALDFQSCLDYVKQLTTDQQAALTSDLMAERGTYDQPLREFEYAQMTVEVVMDQGAYFEFKRHRMMTQTVQPLSTALGFAVPAGITESGCEKDYLAAMRQAAQAYEMIGEWNPAVASYIVPNGFNRRVLFTINLRQAFHLCRLRGATNAHFSIQRVAYQLAEAINQIYPHLGRYLDLPNELSCQAIEKDCFSKLRAF